VALYILLDLVVYKHLEHCIGRTAQWLVWSWLVERHNAHSSANAGFIACFFFFRGLALVGSVALR
jgi:hypothetical protein